MFPLIKNIIFITLKSMQYTCFPYMEKFLNIICKIQSKINISSNSLPPVKIIFLKLIQVFRIGNYERDVTTQRMPSIYQTVRTFNSSEDGSDAARRAVLVPLSGRAAGSDGRTVGRSGSALHSGCWDTCSIHIIFSNTVIYSI